MENETLSPKTMNYAELLTLNLEFLHTAIVQKESRYITRLLRHLPLLRSKVQPNILWHLCDHLFQAAPPALGSKPAQLQIANDLYKMLKQCQCVQQPMDVDEPDLPETKEEKDMKNTNENSKNTIKLPTSKGVWLEFQVFVAFLILVDLIDKRELEKAIDVASHLVTFVKTLNLRILDLLAAKIYFFYSWASELAGQLELIRSELLAIYRTACLHRDSMTQATLLNLILRNYLHYDLYDFALKFVITSAYPQNLRSSCQYARYLYYIGKIDAVQLEYSDSYSKLTQSLRNAYQRANSCKGFRLAATKLAVVVELLMGDIPDRSTFNQKDLRFGLLPYMHIVKAVRSGDLNAFDRVMQRYEATFLKDKTLFLIKRLHQKVIRAGLRMINLSYSQISLADIANKLGLDNIENTSCIVSKAILDGVISATIDLNTGCVKSKSIVNVYGTSEPVKALNKRINLCLQLYTDAVKAMQYPEAPDPVKNEAIEPAWTRQQEDFGDEDDICDDLDLL